MSKAEKKYIITVVTALETFIIAVQRDLSWLSEYMNVNMLNI